MERVSVRKVQMTGGSTFIVSLPKDWVKAVQLKAGDEVTVIRRPDMKLLIAAKGRYTSNKVVVKCGNGSKDMVVREFVSYYTAGHSLITLVCPDMKTEERTYVKDQIRRRLLGAEVIEEDAEKISVQFLVGVNELSVSRTIARTATISYHMLKDVVKSLVDGDVDLASEVPVRDDEVDRFYFYVARQLSLSSLNQEILEEDGFSMTHIINIYAVARSIERVADHATRLANLVRDLLSDKLAVENLATLAESVIAIYRESTQAFIKKDKRSSQEILSSMDSFVPVFGEATKTAVTIPDVKSASSTVLALESLRRVYRYSIDIAESTVDMLAKDEPLRS
jgi:Phosphate uptake regulator